jgi:glycosyltransferase involved in cell wall biosynthesis
MKPVLLYRRSLDIRSGAGQLIRMQANGLKQAGVPVRIACQRGALKYFLRTGWPVKTLKRSGLGLLNNLTDHIVVDHEMHIPDANLLFVHSLETVLYQDHDDWAEGAAREAAFFKKLAPTTTIVANSKLTKAALIEYFELDAQRIRVHYPGYQSAKFGVANQAALRLRARGLLKVDERTPLVGLLTSGDFRTRGLDTFLECADRISQVMPNVQFLVVGSKRLPEWAAAHPLLASGRVHYRPKSGRPELWLAALDLFLYPSRFDSFGMVISEAQALGIPVLTSRRVGASECLPEDYAPWLIERPSSEAFTELALKLLADEKTRQGLAAVGLKSVVALDQDNYARTTVATILNQKR